MRRGLRGGDGLPQYIQITEICRVTVSAANPTVFEITGMMGFTVLTPPYALKLKP